MRQTIKIPDLITVHAGAPDSPALNYTIPFADYIKNVVSRAVSPLWPEAAIRAVILAAQTYALRRHIEGHYRGRGYGFDLTGHAEYDQRFEPDSCVFANVSRLADELSDVYIASHDSLSPVAIRVDNGDRGWVYSIEGAEKGTGLTPELACRLASKGGTPVEILREAFGDVMPVRGKSSDPAGPTPECKPLSVGDRGREVSDLQRRLNLISTSFTAIPKINPSDGFYGPSTEEAVRRFQRIFELPDTGKADCATRRRAKIVYDTVWRYLKFRERQSLPAMAEKATQVEPFRIMTEGDSGENVRYAQNLLNFASLYTRTVKPVPPTGVYDRATTESVVDFQLTFDLPPTGDIDLDTYTAMLKLHDTAYSRMQASAFIPHAVPFGGRELRLGSRGDDVYRLQTYLNCAADLYGDMVGKVRINGVYSAETRDAVRAVQRIHNLPQTGTVKEGDWDILAALYNDCAAARFLDPEQYPGYLLQNTRNNEVSY